MRLSIQEDSRAPFGLPIALVDTLTNKVVTCSRSVADAEKQRAVLMMGGPLRRVNDPQRFADPAGCFPIACGTDAFRSWTDVHTRGVQLRYSPSEYAGLVNTVESALLHYYGVVPELRDDDNDEPDGGLGDDDGDNEDDPDDDGGDDGDDRLRDGTPYSAAYFIALGKPREGDFEQRRPWLPATPADRRPNR